MKTSHIALLLAGVALVLAVVAFIGYKMSPRFRTWMNTSAASTPVA